MLFLDEGPEERTSLLPPDRRGGARARCRTISRKSACHGSSWRSSLENRPSVAYINVPKFKTHCMTTVTLGIKNQWGLVAQKDRIADHNHLLPRKLVDILDCLRPDFTLIDAREATQHGHYPSQRLLDRILVPYGLIIGGDDVVSVDAVGCHLMGLPWREVEHVRLAHERGLGTAELDEIEVIGDPARHRKELSWELLPIFPEDVDVHKGEERCCREGCAIECDGVLFRCFSLDFQGKGGFSVVMGKGWDPPSPGETSGKGPGRREMCSPGGGRKASSARASLIRSALSQWLQQPDRDDHLPHEMDEGFAPSQCFPSIPSGRRFSCSRPGSEARFHHRTLAMPGWPPLWIR